MSWTAVLVLSVGAYLFKAAGVLGGRLAVGPVALRTVALLPPALLAALVVVQTFGGDAGPALDERAVGLAVAGVAVWRRAPFVVVVVLAAAVTAGLRALA
ncbi:MAG: AzlD domain-containing protein [Actinobacteria bacterium]|nr:AzlD domain-containing protein [Actinomycetota bacterium]